MNDLLGGVAVGAFIAWLTLVLLALMKKAGVWAFGELFGDDK